MDCCFIRCSGVIATDPTQLDLTELEEVMDASNDNIAVWMLSGQDLQHGGEEEGEDDDEVTYGLHLDLLPEGSKVGIMVNDVGELHYYLNGQDKGCAYTGIPEGTILSTTYVVLIHQLLFLYPFCFVY